MTKRAANPAAALRAAVENAGSQAAVATAAKVSRSKLCRWLQGTQRLTLDEAARVAAAVGLRLTLETVEPPTKRGS